MTTLFRKVLIGMTTMSEAEECHYCGQNDPDVTYTPVVFGPGEPSSLVCEDCMEEKPWK